MSTSNQTYKELAIPYFKEVFDYLDEKTVKIEARVAVNAKTGVEMEALTAVSVAALTVYDMCKALDREMIIGPIGLVEKSGGKSGHFVRELKAH